MKKYTSNIHYNAMIAASEKIARDRRRVVLQGATIALLFIGWLAVCAAVLSKDIFVNYPAQAVSSEATR